ncbi:T6SS effector phospholipase Tle3 domain-containing protein [Burkholderia ubonensis]|uniref:T6SS effector phospholipase Tle3 domain-containing protein n=1 Tax=Burkholderia ubonensis TaxID=101571 RepID=UPI00403295F3
MGYGRRPGKTDGCAGKLSTRKNVKVVLCLIRGSLFVFCLPHDRVVGSTPLQSIGWKGVGYWLRDPSTPKEGRVAFS